jgi:hypothetical protein
VRISLADEEAISAGEFACHLAFREIFIGMFNENALDILHIVEKNHRHGSEMESTDIADCCEAL